MAKKYTWEERIRFGERAKQKSHDTIARLLDNWNYNWYKYPDAKTISDKTGINLDSVYGHMKDFKDKIDEIKAALTLKWKEEREKRELASKQEILKNTKPTENTKNKEDDEWLF